MIKIDPQTGDVFWGEYTLGLRRSHDEFSLSYPQISPRYTMPVISGMLRSDYALFSEMVEEFPCMLKISFNNQHLSYVSVQLSEEIEVEEDGDEQWTDFQLNWINGARRLLRGELGEPHQIDKAQLIDEESELPPEFVKELQDWKYTFDWGNVIFWHDCLRWTDEISVHYNHFAQISSWDELVTECERRIENTRIFNVRNLDLMVETRHLIDVIRHDFDFQTIKSTFGSDGLGFWLRKQKTWALVSIFPEKRDRKYHLGRGDTLFQADVDEANLIETLRLFIESEKLES